MKGQIPESGSPERRGRNSRGGLPRARVVGVGAALAAIAIGAFWLIRPEPSPVAGKNVPETERVPESPLSEPTRKVLRQLKGPVEIRFYAVLNDTLGSTGSRLFAERVSNLLAKYERESHGQIRVDRIDAGRSGAQTAALADGMEPLHPGGTGTEFLGVSLSCREHRAVIPKLAPEWEAALEFDLSRTLLRVTGIAAGGEGFVDPAPEPLVAWEELLRAYPEFESLSVEEARRQLLNSGLDEFRQAAAAIQIELENAKRRLADARTQGDAAVEVARKELETLQVSQSERLSAISQRMRDRIDALERAKSQRR